MYVIAAVQSNRPDKVNEFFEKMTPQLQGQSGWSEWFGETNCFFTSSCYLVGVVQVTLLFRLPSLSVLSLSFVSAAMAVHLLTPALPMSHFKLSSPSPFLSLFCLPCSFRHLSIFLSSLLRRLSPLTSVSFFYCSLHFLFLISSLFPRSSISN